MTYRSPSIPSLSDLESFISVAAAGLSQRVTEGDYGGLVEVMGHLLAVKERQHITDSMFEPLQQTIALLKVYEQELPDVVYKQLEVKAGALSCQLLFTATHSFFSFTQLWQGHYFFFVSFNCPSPLCSLAAGNLSSVTAAHFAFLLPRHISPSLYLSVRLPIPTAGAAGEVEQRAEAGCVGQTAGGAAAGHRGGRPASQVRRVRRGAAHPQGDFSDQGALQVEQMGALFESSPVYCSQAVYTHEHLGVVVCRSGQICCLIKQ